MATIDVQVHAYERDHPARPWTAVLEGPDEVTGDDMVAAMDAVGVEGALLVSPFTMYQYDASYAINVHAAHPGRFALIKPVDATDAGVAETIADWARMDGTVAIRVMMQGELSDDPGDPGINRVLDAAARHGLPVNLLAWGQKSGYKAGHRSPWPATAVRAAGPAGTIRRPAQAVEFGAIRQCHREILRRLHPVP